MYISKIAIVGREDSKVKKVLQTSLSELGYFINYKNSKGMVYIGNLSKKLLLKLLLKYNKVSTIISVSDSGEYVIPIIGEENGGGILGGIIADILNAQLVLTSRFSGAGLISINEFCWINALKPLNCSKVKNLSKKFIRIKKLNIYNDDTSRDYFLPEGYELVKNPLEADIIITEKNIYSKQDSLILKPLKVIIGVVYNDKVPKPVIRNAIELTNKSIAITSRRIDNIIYTELKKDDEPSKICRNLLISNKAKIVLKTTKRALDVYTCLGIVDTL